MRSKAYFFQKLPESPIKLAMLFSVPFLLIGMILLTSLIFWEIENHKKEQVSGLTEAAKAFFEQILVTRQWNADHGGVYVEVTEQTQPNPYLEFDEERDIVTVEGRRYTKMNPAYMTRQISELADKRKGYKFHVTSLRPVNPYNRADEWEAEALKEFEKGVKEKSIFATLNGMKYFRYMAPLFVESACLKCHEREGYRVDEVRGGITVNMPVSLSDAIYEANIKRILITYGIVGVSAMLFIFAVTWVLSLKISKGMKQELEYEKLKAAVHLAAATAHELRQPMSIITGFAELLKDKVSNNENPKQEAEVIVQQCLRMNEIIKKMLNITSYKTKAYDEDTEIFDLDVKKPADENNP